ncbi:hypothetical protein ACW180_03275 [Limosilactobacillus fermentum]
MGKDTEGYQFFFGLPGPDSPSREAEAQEILAQVRKRRRPVSKNRWFKWKTSGGTWLSNSIFRGGEHEVLVTDTRDIRYNLALETYLLQMPNSI